MPATNNNRLYTPTFEQIVKKVDLGLDQLWNKAPVPSHRGRHPHAYHEWVLNTLNSIADELLGCKLHCQERFVEQFREQVVAPVLKNPEILRKSYWQRMKKIQ